MPAFVANGPDIPESLFDEMGYVDEALLMILALFV